jgi:trehalose 6-phosphate synthase/phosphatase
VHVVSGRPRAELERWFGALPIGLHAEHGMYSRIDGDWVARGVVPEDLRARVKATLEQVASCTPGSHVEVKAVGLAWHYRQAEPEHGAHQARQLRVHLRDVLTGTPLEVLAGDKVVEVRLRGMHKGLVLRGLLRPGDLALAVGDDRTDEDLFAALPDDAMTVKVGRGSSVARHTCRTWPRCEPCCGRWRIGAERDGLRAGAWRRHRCRSAGARWPARPGGRGVRCGA